MSENHIPIIRPDDWHLHLRDGEMLYTVLPFSARVFRRALVMPNLKPPITTAEMALRYRERILNLLPIGLTFEPWMTLYLTDKTSPEEIRRAKEGGVVLAAKLYPAGATTNSDSGVTKIEKIYPALEVMQEVGLVLCVHGEVTDPEVDIFDREAVFIDRVLRKIMKDFPNLKIIMEHVTTAEAVEFVRDGPSNLAATITPHHPWLNRNALLVGGIQPHNYCLPVLKRERHREALVEAMTSGDVKFFAGTDSAPHRISDKESACGCAGIFNAYTALETYAEIFDQVGRLDRLEGFVSRFGAEFYGLPVNTDAVTLTRDVWEVPIRYSSVGDVKIRPFRAGEMVSFSVIS